jgi:hypothetical protein
VVTRRQPSASPAASGYFERFFAVTFLFYELSQGRNIRQAITRLRRHDPELSMWRLHTTWQHLVTAGHWGAGRRELARCQRRPAVGAIRPVRFEPGGNHDGCETSPFAASVAVTATECVALSRHNGCGTREAAIF